MQIPSDSPSRMERSVVPETDVTALVADTQNPEITEPDTETIRRREEFGDIDPWFFEQKNLMAALYKLRETEPERAERITDFLDNSTVVGDFVMRAGDNAILLADSMETHEVTLIVEAICALDEIEQDQTYTPGNQELTAEDKVRGLAGAAFTASGSTAPFLALSTLTQAGMYGLVAGGAMLGLPVIRKMWQDHVEDRTLDQRALECADILESLQQKLIDNPGVSIPNKMLEIDLGELRRSKDGDYAAYRQVIYDYMRRVKTSNPEADREDSTAAYLLGDDYDKKWRNDRRERSVFYLNPVEGFVQLIEGVDEINPDQLGLLWHGDAEHVSLKQLIEDLNRTLGELQRVRKHGRKVLSLEQEDGRDDWRVAAEFADLQKQKEKAVRLVALRFAKLCQDTMLSLVHPPEEGEDAQPQWPLLGR